MDDGLKQRLIGAVVLVLAAIIFIPMLFDDTQTPEDIKVAIPKRPEVPKLAIRSPERPSRPVTESEPPVADVDTAVDESDEPQVPTAKTVAEKRLAWTLQLASFAELNNAETLRDKLRNENYKSYIKYRPDKQPPLIQVFVGPELSRVAIDRLKAELEDKLELEGIVVRYDP